MKSRVYMISKPNTPFSGATRNIFYYETEVDGHLWLADIEEDQMYEPTTFEIDPDPCGIGFKDQEHLKEYLMSEHYTKKPAKIVGYIEDGKLFITKKIRMETGWSGFGPMFPTSFEYIYPNVKAGAK